MARQPFPCLLFGDDNMTDKETFEKLGWTDDQMPLRIE
jgi:hypothetical protein